MNLTTVNHEIEKHFNYWKDQFSRIELNCNNARITAEYICKACIIKKFGESKGKQIILNKEINIYCHPAVDKIGDKKLIYDELRMFCSLVLKTPPL